MIYWSTSNTNCPVKLHLTDPALNGLDPLSSLLLYFNPFTGATVWGGSNAVAGVSVQADFAGKVTPGNNFSSIDVEVVPIGYQVSP
jgi:hypothetical protein